MVFLPLITQEVKQFEDERGKRDGRRVFVVFEEMKFSVSYTSPHFRLVTV